MSRNGSGTYTVPNTFVAGTTITASDHNDNWSDIGAEISNSVAADGQTTMTGQLLGYNAGSVTAPSYTFASDTNTGIYRIGADNIGVTCGGTKILDVSSTGLNVIGTVKQNSFALLPIGTILPYGGSSAPSGYLFCYGQSLLRTDYPDLFAAIGTTYGAADGTHFSVPDLRGRVVAGQDDMGGSSANRLTNADDGLDGDTLGATGGGETQTLATANLPAYTPAGTNATSLTVESVTHSLAASQPVQATGAAVGYGGTPTFGKMTVAAQTFTGTAQGGTSTAFGVVQPTIILNYIIFAGV